MFFEFNDTAAKKQLNEEKTVSKGEMDNICENN